MIFVCPPKHYPFLKQWQFTIACEVLHYKGSATMQSPQIWYTQTTAIGIFYEIIRTPIFRNILTFWSFYLPIQ